MTCRGYVYPVIYINNCINIISTCHNMFICDDTRGCIIQFWPAGDKHIVLETCRGMKWTFCNTNFVHRVG